MERMRYYLMGIIFVILAMNIPEVKTLIEDRVKIAAPQIGRTLTLTFNETSAAIVPLVGKIIGKPVFTINGKSTPVDTADDWSLTHGQSLTADQIEDIFKESRSPAVGTGKYWIQAGVENNIDAAYLLAIYQMESTLGTNNNWIGLKEGGDQTYNIGNIRCADYPTCYKGFRDYSNASNPWWFGIEASAEGLKQYRDERHIKTFDDAIMIWAPPNENNTTSYIESSHTLIRAWRNTNKVIANEGGTVLQAVQDNGSKIPFGDAQSVSAPITEDPNNDFGLNVKAALDANNNALRNVVIKDGEQWSFNQSIGNPNSLHLVNVSGVYGGGWCDLACRYVQALKGLGVSITHGSDINTAGAVFLQHGGIALNNCTYDESPYIWSAGNKGFDSGMQDLIVNNTTGKTIHLIVVDNEDGTATIAGKLE